MAEIRPFCGWRYDTGQIGSLANVVAPPCDCIDDALRDELYARHECNVVRLTLNRPEPGDNPGTSAERAGQNVRHWKNERVLCRDHEAAIYVVHQEFNLNGKGYTRRGFIARVGLDRTDIKTHEKTNDDYTAGRVALLESCGLNLSPVLGFYRDQSSTVQELLDDATRGITALEVTDPDGVLNRMWTVTDHSTIGLATELLANSTVYVADGHHRLASSFAYQKNQSTLSPPTEDNPANFAMMHLVASGDAGLMLLPNHRIVSGLNPTASAELQRLIEPDFGFETASSPEEAWELLQIDGRPSVLGLGTSDGLWVMAIAKEPADAAANNGDIIDRLGLHRLSAEGEEVAFGRVRSVEAAVAAIEKQQCQLACLQLPPDIDTITSRADNSLPFPGKHTHFYPKTPAGLVFYSVR